MAARGHVRGRVIPLGRNQRGFALFLRNLKSVLNLLISQHELEIEVLLQTRHRLLDGWGILSFLMNDIANSVIATGIPSYSLEEPVRNLKCSLTELITSLSDQIKSRENAIISPRVRAFEENLLKFKQRLRTRGYPRTIIERSLSGVNFANLFAS